MWYVADLVEEITVEGESDNVVHINSVLIEADGDEAAYAAALAEAPAGDEYENPKGQTVRTRFVGVRELTRVHDELEHGAELRYEERVGVPDEELSSFASERGELAVFRPLEPRTGPDYTSREIMEEVDEVVRRSQASGDGSAL